MKKYGCAPQTSWDWRAACNFMFGGTGSALIFIAAVASFPHSPPQSLGLIALALIGLGLFSVWLEIGRPWRFLHVFFHPQTSWMTREASVAVVLFGLILAGIALENSFVMWIAGSTGLVFLYCQGRMLQASKGIPSWREPTIVLLIVVTGICEGAAAWLLFLCLEDKISVGLSIACLVFLATRITSWLVYKRNLGEARLPEQTSSAIGKIHHVQIFAGTIIPALLIAVSTVMPERAGPGIIGAGVLMIIAGWYMKFMIITRAAQVQGYGFNKLKRGRPVIRPPVRRKPDRFVF